MNRWRQRLAELHGEGAEPRAAFPHDVQNVQNIQNPAPAEPFVQFEHFEHPTEALAAPTAAADCALATWGEAQAERAAIVEHDGKIPRAWAGGLAKLHPDRPPAAVPPPRWRTFIDDIGRFHDAGWAVKAAALGWGPYDLFGCDRDRPYARIDQAGLLWLLDGIRTVALSENTATIETRTGARQTWRRKPGELARVLAWELAQ
jgi:hypothetical protein